MKNLKGSIFGLVALAVALSITPPALAENTQVLPKGRSSVSLAYFQDAVQREFDDSGDNRELAFYLNHVNITALANQSLLKQTGPLPFDIVQSANTYLDARADVYGAAFSFQYGVTDKLTVGIGLPYFMEARGKVDFGINLKFTAPAIAAGIDDLILASTTPIGMVQSYLHDELGYDPVESWEGDPGVGDLIVGAKYRFLDQDQFKSALSGFVSIPTGTPDDERCLTDIAYGTGSYLTGLSLIADLTPVDWLTWSFSGGYVFDLPHQRGVFVLDRDNPVFYKSEFPTIHKNGRYDRGDYYVFESDLYLMPAPGVKPYVGYRYLQAGADYIDGDKMPKTERISRKLIIGLSASAVESYLDGKAKLPMVFNVYAEPVQTGRNVEQDARVYLSASLIF